MDERDSTIDIAEYLEEDILKVIENAPTLQSKASLQVCMKVE